ncbi:MAG TPA: hypothetical protein VMM38_00770 [Aridibacter sp.]|nr:hypothetical protein [Aridibacter sp.]
MRTCLRFLSICLVLAAAVTAVHPCACCAEKGTYFSSTSAIDEYERDILSKMKFAPAASLYLDAAGFEVVNGLEALQKIYESSETASEFDEIKLRASVGSSFWMLTFSLDNAVGALTLPFPAEREYYAADIHDGKDSSGGGPLLYKELRFRGKVGSASNMFSEGFKGGADYLLVFQGRGNGCNNVEDFTHWRLSVNGPKARYAFFGKLTSGEARSGDTAQDRPKFEDHTTEIWNGTAKAVDLNSHKDARMFRTRLQEARNEGVNFAGHYILTYWGCGTNCLVGAVIDGKTGKVFFPEEMAGLGVGLPGTDIEAEAVEFRKDSLMLIVRGALSDDDGVGTHYLVWEGDRFRKLKFSE